MAASGIFVSESGYEDCGDADAVNTEAAALWRRRRRQVEKGHTHQVNVVVVVVVGGGGGDGSVGSLNIFSLRLVSSVGVEC